MRRVTRLLSAVPLLTFFMLAVVQHAHAVSVTFSTQGAFRCLNPSPAFPCSGGGDSITIGSGENTLSLFFTGVNTTLETELVPGAQSSILTSFGQIRTSVTGTGFTLPPILNIATPRVFLDITFMQSGPVMANGRIPTVITGAINQNFSSAQLQTGLIALSGSGSNFVTLPGPGRPIVYSFGAPYDLAPPAFNNGVTDIQGTVGAVPEPATILLLGTGLAGVGAAVRKKRKANKSEEA